MKTIAKILVLMAIIFGMKLSASAKDNSSKQVSGDSVVVNFGKGGRMVIVMKDPGDIEELKNIDFNKLIEEMTAYIDSAKNAEDGKVVVTTEKGEFRIYVEEVEDDDTFIVTLGNKHIYVGQKKKFEDWKEKKKHSRTRSFTDFYLGLNGYLEDGSTPSGVPYELRPFGSRYFEFAFKKETRLGGEKSKFYLNYGLGFSWYNFMLDTDFKFENVDGQIQFTQLMDDDNEVISLKKTKLVASYVNIPVMLMTKTDNFRFGLGGYVGYRLGSHTKVKYLDDNGDWQKDKDFGNFNLNNLRYGLQTEIGVKGITLFGKYDLNELFDSNSGAPKLNAFAFGIRL